MKRSLLLLLLACFLPSMCFAQQTVQYKLSGNYIAQFHGTEISAWHSILGGCSISGIPQFAEGGGSLYWDHVLYGTLTFNGTGVNGTLTSNNFDQAKSNATVKVTWSTDGKCTPKINDGYPIFDPPKSKSLTATYTINAADGTGTISTFRGLNAPFQTTGSWASCASGGTIYVIPNTMMIQATNPANAPYAPNVIVRAGIAEHANGVLLACP